MVIVSPRERISVCCSLSVKTTEGIARPPPTNICHDISSLSLILGHVFTNRSSHIYCQQKQLFGVFTCNSRLRHVSHPLYFQLFSDQLAALVKKEISFEIRLNFNHEQRLFYAPHKWLEQRSVPKIQSKQTKSRTEYEKFS